MILAVHLDGSYRWQCDECGDKFDQDACPWPKRCLCRPFRNNCGYRWRNPGVSRFGRADRRYGATTGGRGFYQRDNLLDAQEKGLCLCWAHDLA